MRPGLVQSFVLTVTAAVFVFGSASAQVCTEAWFHSVESRLGTGDAQGHGPDVGSEEWKSVVEFRLGVRGLAEVPPRDDERWCAYVEKRLHGAETQARNGLAREIGPVRYVCDDAATQIVVSFFETEPRTLIARRGDEEVLMYVAVSASGARYAGGGAWFWEHQGEARVVWSERAAELRCVPEK